jgi:hypothetical protein
MKKTFVKLSIIALSFGLLFTACSKKKDSTNPDDSNQQATTAADQSDVTTESDQSVNDANTVIGGSASNERTDGNLAIVIGASIDTTNWNSGKYIITYNGNNLNDTKKRTGTITIQRTVAKWSVPGSVLTITYNNYKVTKLSTGKSITLNGTLVVTNVSTSTNTYWTLPVNSSIEHKIRGALTITFDDGTQRIWNIARHKTITNHGSFYYTLSIAGDTAVSSYSHVEAWGINRNGEHFYGETTSAIVYSTSCGFDPISGVYVHQGIARTLTATFGVNSDGTVNTSLTCPYGWKIDWINASGNAKEVIKAY